LTTGEYNTAVGSAAMDAVTTGSSNVGVGVHALSTITDGGGNTAVGYQACYVTTASNNSAFGDYSLVSCTTGANNCCYGSQSGYNITTGANNTTVGRNAGYDLTGGANNVLIGLSAGRSTSPSGILQTASNKVVIGNNDITTSYVKVDWTVTSDRRDKTDIEPFNHGLSWINKLNPVTYRWDNRSFYDNGIPDGSKKQSKLNVGLIAQDEIEVEKEHGYGDTADNMLVTDVNADGNYGMQYSKLVPILINAVKELSAKNEALEARLAALESK